jgi:hypothetical protein
VDAVCSDDDGRFESPTVASLKKDAIGISRCLRDVGPGDERGTGLNGQGHEEGIELEPSNHQSSCLVCFNER